MKKITLLSTLCLPFFVLSCLNGPTSNRIENLTSNDKYYFCQPINEYHLSLSDIQSLIDITSINTKGGDSPSIEEIQDEEETIFYLVQYKEGWKLYSSDMRTFPIIAWNEKGDFKELVSFSEGIAGWMSGMALDMKTVKHSTNDELKLNSDEIDENVNFWLSILERNAPLSLSKFETKVDPMPTGHYELVATETDLIVYDSIPHLTTTRWNEGSPYNQYCPYCSANYSGHAYAGSLSIAGAQMLYYLHYLNNIPEEAPSYAYVLCNVDSVFQSAYMYQGDYNSAIWDDMSSNPSSAAPLIANIGNLTNTRYTANGSYANTDNLLNAFSSYGISATLTSYNSSYVVSSLLAGYPVVATGTTTRTWVPFTYQYSGYHSFLIDGYVRYRTRTKNTYTWVWDIDPTGYSGILPNHNDTYTYTYGSQYIRYVKMNWCEGVDINNDTNFTLTDDWVYNSHFGYQLNYQYDRKLIIIDY